MKYDEVWIRYHSHEQYRGVRRAGTPDTILQQYYAADAIQSLMYCDSFQDSESNIMFRRFFKTFSFNRCREIVKKMKKSFAYKHL